MEHHDASSFPSRPLHSTLLHLAAIQQGSDLAPLSWARLDAKLQARLLRLPAARELPPGTGPDEFVQLVLIRVWRALPAFVIESRGSFWNWVRTIASHALADLWRRHRQHCALDAVAEPVDERATEAARESARWEEYARLQTLLSGLRARYRYVLELRTLRELPYEQVAQALDLQKVASARAVHCRAVAAVKRLAESEPQPGVA